MLPACSPLAPLLHFYISLSFGLPLSPLASLDTPCPPTAARHLSTRPLSQCVLARDEALKPFKDQIDADEATLRDLRDTMVAEGIYKSTYQAVMKTS